jgi:diguanylate cyclase (GGDEF)-like protein/PAS domain S-box-containing protein
MDSGPEEVFDRVTRVAARVLGAPLAFLTLLDGERQYFKSRLGAADDAVPLPAAVSYCRHVVEDPVPLVVDDLRHDPRIGDPSHLIEEGLLAYCGVPLTDSEGNTLGTLCTMDHAPHRWSPDDVELLSELAAGATAEIELRMVLTEERRLRDELERSERRFRRTFDDAPTGITLIGSDRRLISANRAFLEMVGYRAEELVGRTLEHITHPEDRARDRVAGRSPASGERERHETETRYLHRSGHTVSVRLSAAPLHDEQGDVQSYVVHTRDLTREREATSAQRAIEQRHRRLLAHLPDTMVILYDRSMRIELMQGGLLTELGLESDSYIGRSLLEVIAIEEEQILPGPVARALRGESSTIDLDVRGTDSVLDHVFQIEFAPYLGEDGSITGAFTVWRDISERHRQEEARRAIAEELRVTIEHAPIGVALVDLTTSTHGRLLSVNGAFSRLLSDPDPVVAGRTLDSMVHPDDRAALRNDLALLASDDLARIEVEVRCQHPNGDLTWLLLTGSAVPAGDGGPQRAVVHALDIGERKRFEGQLQHLADHDPLTGLFNRRRFEHELTRAVSVVERYGTPSALLLVDLDGFKHVNDTLGHSFGDEILTRVAAALRTTLRETDVIGRLGGDEFAVLVSSVSAREAHVVAEKVLTAIREHGVVVAERTRATVSGSIGVATLTRESHLDAEGLLARADAAMYAAKQEGRDRIAFAGEGESLMLTAHQSWLVRLRQAIEQDRFELFAQPIRGICAEAEDCFELLLRLRGEDGELIAPASFLYNAERFDLIQQIDRWVFGQSLALLSHHAAAGHDICLSVNMSAKTLGDPRLLEDLAAMLADCPIPRDRLIVEVTETAAIVNIDRAREIARALRAMGIRFALDDFGAGFASFYYLKHLDFDFVKIDGEFIKGLTHSATDQLVIRSVVSLAQGLGAQTIAEFVGDEDAVRRLEELGVDFGQGYHLGRPAPVAEILPLPISATLPD